MIRKVISSFILAIVLLLTLVGQGQAFAPELQPSPLPGEPDRPGPFQDEPGLRLRPVNVPGVTPLAEVEPLSTGGPDDFGYTWDDSVPYSRIDASAGTNSGLSASVEQVGPIVLPFTFKFYENSFSQFYISRNGFISFSALPPWHRQGEIPSPEEPNNTIAPYWSPLTVPADGWVKYLTAGSAPNRFLVVQWHKMQNKYDATLLFEFELILHENGDILFQFGSMSQNNYCSSSGIEDSTGLDGLTYVRFCYGDPAPNSAVQFYRPAASARVSMNPLFDGAFLIPNATKDFNLVLRNTGELGADTYDLSTISVWALNFYAEDGTTPLTDTDGDTFLDSGAIAQGGQKKIIARLQAPNSADISNFNNALVTAKSSLNSLKSKTAILQATIPAPFVQVHLDWEDSLLKMDIVKPTGQIQVVSPSIVNSYFPSVTGGPGTNLVNAILSQSYTGSFWVGEINHSVVARDGTNVRSLGKLTNNQAATIDTYDEEQALTTAPNGNIGVIWRRSLYDNGQYNFNIFFTILNPGGDVIFGPVNVTSNATWGDWYGLSNPMIFQAQITALDDNRFVLAWERSMQSTGGWIDDIYYAVRGSAGEEITAPIKLTASTPDEISFQTPRLTSLANNRAFLSWVSNNQGQADIQYSVIGNSGTLIKAATTITAGSNKYDGSNGDVVQLPNGKILAVWQAWSCIPNAWESRLRFAFLDGSYNLVGSPICLGKAPGADAETNVSVTFAGVDKGVITWQDYDYKHVYYSLVDGTGAVIVPPTIFLNSVTPASDIEIGTNGYGNTAYPATFADVSLAYWAQSWIERLYNSGITTGCNFTPTRQYCPEQVVTRAQMAVFLIRATHGVSFVPPAPTGIFTDVPTTAWAANFIEQLYADGITTGCNPALMLYCPAQSVTRAQMAAFLLRAKHGAAYVPPPATGVFTDVPTSYWAAAWIEQLFAENITTGCNTGMYCPEQPVTRAQMAAFLVRTFALP